VLGVLDTTGERDFTFAREERDGDHASQVHPHGVVRIPGLVGVLGGGGDFRGRRGRLGWRG